MPYYCWVLKETLIWRTTPLSAVQVMQMYADTFQTQDDAPWPKHEACCAVRAYEQSLRPTVLHGSKEVTRNNQQQPRHKLVAEVVVVVVVVAVVVVVVVQSRRCSGLRGLVLVSVLVLCLVAVLVLA